MSIKISRIKIFEPNNTPSGLEWEPGFAAEQEFGIKPLLNILGIKEIVSNGLEGRIVQIKESNNFLWECSKGSCFLYISKYPLKRILEEKSFLRRRLGGPNSNSPTVAAWSRDSILLWSKDPIFIEHAKNLVNAINNKRAVIWYGTIGDNPFQKPSLLLLDIAQVDIETKKLFFDADQENLETKS